MTRLEKYNYIATATEEYGPVHPSSSTNLQLDSGHTVLGVHPDHVFTRWQEPEGVTEWAEVSLDRLTDEELNMVFELVQRSFWNRVMSGDIHGEMIDDDSDMSDEELDKLIREIIDGDY